LSPEPYGPPAFGCAATAPNGAKLTAYRDEMPQNDPDHDELRALGSRLDKVRQRDGARKVQPPPTSLGTAFRFATELFAALIVGAAMGWGLDRLFGTSPTFILILGVFGMAAGVRNVIVAAREINAQIAASSGSAQKTDEEK
jgi:ATP synthase protein I